MEPTSSHLPLGQRIAEGLAASVGWKFLIVQTLVIIAWMAVNVMWLFHRVEWDPYPFILLNLCLSLQAAYTGPILLVADKRRERERNRIAHDTNRKITELHNDHNMQMEELKAICVATHAKVHE